MSVVQLFESASARLQRTVRFDSAVWLGTDPVTALPTARSPSSRRRWRTACRCRWSCSEVLPIIAEAYELSLRERQITQCIARGAGTGEIAQLLHLSPHTVRDYVKALFEKLGVSSRGELVAKLFTEHYAPIHYSPAAHVSVSAGSRA